MSEPKSYTLTEAAKLLGIKKTELYTSLRNLQIINPENIAYRRYTAQYLFFIKHGEKNTSATTMATEKGLKWLKKILNKKNLITKKRQREIDKYHQKKSLAIAWRFVLTQPWRQTDKQP